MCSPLVADPLLRSRPQSLPLSPVGRSLLLDSSGHAATAAAPRGGAAGGRGGNGSRLPSARSEYSSSESSLVTKVHTPHTHQAPPRSRTLVRLSSFASLSLQDSWAVGAADHDGAESVASASSLGDRSQVAGHAHAAAGARAQVPWYCAAVACGAVAFVL